MTPFSLNLLTWFNTRPTWSSTPSKPALLRISKRDDVSEINDLVYIVELNLNLRPLFVVTELLDSGTRQKPRRDGSNSRFTPSGTPRSFSTCYHLYSYALEYSWPHERYSQRSQSKHNTSSTLRVPYPRAYLLSTHSPSGY
jgi:hypothetical protein